MSQLDRRDPNTELTDQLKSKLKKNNILFGGELNKIFKVQSLKQTTNANVKVSEPTF